jgi:hypothetical protein
MALIKILMLVNKYKVNYLAEDAVAYFFIHCLLLAIQNNWLNKVELISDHVLD